jgi:hypothetical protein
MFLKIGLTYFITQMGAYYSMKRGQETLKEGKIHDLLHQWLPSTGYDWFFANLILLIFLVAFWIQSSDQDKVDFLEVAMVLFLFRTLTTTITIIPQVNECDYRPGLPSHTCHDMQYSGHTALGTLAFLFLWDRTDLPHAILFAGLLLLYYFIIASRAHYSVDVILGLFVTMAIYSYFSHKWSSL